MFPLIALLKDNLRKAQVLHQMKSSESWCWKKGDKKPPGGYPKNPHETPGRETCYLHAQCSIPSSPFAMQRLVARASCRGGLGATKANVQGAAWRSLSKVGTTGGSRPTSMRAAVTGNSSALTGESRRSVYTWRVPIPLTKIVATIGPASEQFEPLQKVCTQR